MAITTITHEIDLFDSLVAVGIQLTADTAFTGAQRPLHNGDVTAFATFLARARQLSPHWNGSFTTHMHLAVALVKAMTSRLNLPAEDQFLTSFQILAHDVGRLLTHRVVTNEVRGRELLRAMNFVSPFDDIHFGWSYWTGDIFSPSMAPLGRSRFRRCTQRRKWSLPAPFLTGPVESRWPSSFCYNIVHTADSEATLSPLFNMAKCATIPRILLCNLSI